MTTLGGGASSRICSIREKVSMCRLAFVFVLIPAAALAQNSAPVNTLSRDGQSFQVPAGFTIERAADGSLVGRPIVADLDEKGRLYIAEAAGAIERADITNQKKPHRVVRLVDADGDGRYDHSTVFADELAFPEG